MHNIMRCVLVAWEQQHSFGVNSHGCGDAVQSTTALQMGRHAPCCTEPPCHARFCPPSTGAQCSFAPMHTEGLSHLHSTVEHELHHI